ncbi:hypothetical protein BH23THE1_BH23THE1_09130 [soil metagenome]
MFGFEITADLFIVAIFAQTIAISLIILIIYFKIKKIQYKNIDLNEKIGEKLDRVESKLSYLYNQVLIISANQDKFKYPLSSRDPSTHYRTKGTTHDESDSLSLLKDTTLDVQNSMYSRTIDTGKTTAIPKESETEFIPVLESSSLPPNNNSFSEKSTRNNLGEATDRNSARDFVQNNKEPANSKVFTDNDLQIEKNTNPEIDKIEKEILTALMRLGGSDGSSSDFSRDGEGSSGGGQDVIYPTAKRFDRKVKNVD